jgi:hypothetical protein
VKPEVRVVADGGGEGVAKDMDDLSEIWRGTEIDAGDGIWRRKEGRKEGRAELTLEEGPERDCEREGVRLSGAGGQ